MKEATEKTKRVSLKKYIMRIPFFIIIILFLILIFILKASALFFEKQAVSNSTRFIEFFLINNQEIFKKGDSGLMRVKIDRLIEHSEVIEIKIYNRNGDVVFNRQKESGENGVTLFALSPIVIEKKIRANGTYLGKFRLKVIANEESYILQIFALILLGIFILFSLFFLLFVRNYNKKIDKELLLLKDSIEKKVEAETVQTKEFNIEELALFQRKIKRDSKDLRVLKEELEKKENLALIGNFASSIVHDIRNPLSVIEGYTDMLVSRLSEEDLRFTNKIFNSTSMIARMLEDILKFVREQKLELNIKKNNPGKVIQTAVDFLERVIGQKSILIAREVETEHLIECDIERLSLAIMNLLKNSIEISRNGDTVTIKAYKDKGTIVFLVRDTGPGIPENIRETIFEPFITANKKKGTGLGLFIVKEIVKAHNGTLSFKTGPSGTEFLIKIPDDKKK